MEQMPPIEISVRIDGQLVKRNLSEDLRVDEEHINDYLLKAPAITAYWNTLYEQQRSATTRCRVALERKKAELDQRFRKEAKADGRKISNTEVEALIMTHGEYTVLEDEYLNHRETELTLKGAVEAVKEYRSTLISLSANMRSSGTVKINASPAEETYRKRFVGA